MLVETSPAQPQKVSKFNFEINPYSKWVDDYPAILLADPTPVQLQGKFPEISANWPLVVDLGCGSGNFLLQMAAARPSALFVGFELRYKRLVKAARKFEKAGLGNVWVLKESVERFDRYFPPESISELHLNFPDPWPKRGQWKKRLVTPGFLERVESLLMKGGVLSLKTDHSGYFLHVLTLIQQRKNLGIKAFSNDLTRHPLSGTEWRTEFEQLFRSRKKAIYHLVLEKISATG